MKDERDFLAAFAHSFACKPRDEDLMGPFRERRPDSSHLPTRPMIEVASLRHAEAETLFAAVAFGRRPYERFVAAGLLRGRGWRFHRKFQVWLRRAGEPRETSEAVERGDFLLFDWAESWRSRERQNFTFELRFAD